MRPRRLTDCHFNKTADAERLAADSTYKTELYTLKNYTPKIS
jgi:hypothetical protein